jgi:hypothetical protein
MKSSERRKGGEEKKNSRQTFLSHVCGEPRFFSRCYSCTVHNRCSGGNDGVATKKKRNHFRRDPLRRTRVFSTPPYESLATVSLRPPGTVAAASAVLTDVNVLEAA